jgi:hypothetical protein
VTPPPGALRRLSTLAALLVVAGPCAAGATQRFGALEISGNLQSQNLIRTPNAGDLEFIMNRNTAHVRLDYDWVERGRLIGRYELPFVERSHLFLLWRGVYDSIYDVTPGFVEKEDFHGKAYAGKGYFDYATQVRGLDRHRLTLDSLTDDARDALKFDNQLREAYFDLRLRGIPLTVRAGRQQIVWGESDNFRLLDRVNALDTTWHLVQEVPPPGFGWDEIRRPYWMLKFLYDLGDLWKLSQSFLEWYWNPGDWYPVKIAFLPRPWGVRALDPLTNPIDGAFNRGVCETAPNSTCTRLMNGTRLYVQGNYSRNPMENSQAGVRYHGITPQGLELTLNYFYQRWAGDDGTPSAPVRGLPKNTANLALAFNQLIPKGIFPAEFYAPYVHTVGLSANYAEDALTETVFRFETVYDVGIPFFDLGRQTVIDRPLLPGITKKNMWKGMLAFDRPTWIRSLNKRSTIFLTGQFFWHYLPSNPDCEPQVVANLTAAERARRNIRSCLVGPLDLPSSVRLGTATSPAFRDKIRDWETLFTLAGFTFYRGGSVIPVLGVAVDPMNHFDMEAFWSLDYSVRTDLTLNLTQRYFILPHGQNPPVFDPWGFASLQGGRSETGLRATYQF